MLSEFLSVVLPQHLVALRTVDIAVVVASERMPLLGALALGGMFVIGGALVAWLSWKLGTGAVGRNGVVGLRLPSTAVSDEAWQAGQRGFAPFGIAAGVGCAVLAAPVFFRLTQGWATLLLSAASIWLVVLPALGAFVGDQAAKDAAGER